MKTSHIAVFPGSFDPFTVGHEEIVRRTLPLFEKIIVAFGSNASKQGYFPLKKRMLWVSDLFKDEPKVVIDSYDGLTVDFCVEKGANFLLRGLRTAADFEYEKMIGQVNRAMRPEVETLFLLTKPEHSAISSSIVREIYRHGGDTSPFVPKGIILET